MESDALADGIPERFFVFEKPGVHPDVLQLRAAPDHASRRARPLQQVWIVRPLALHAQAVKAFCEPHERQVRSLCEQGGVAVMVFDLTALQVVDGWLAIVTPLIQMMQRLAEDYKRWMSRAVLVCNDDAVVAVLELVFTTMCLPTRPVQIVRSHSDLHRELATIWPPPERP